MSFYDHVRWLTIAWLVCIGTVCIIAQKEEANLTRDIAANNLFFLGPPSRDMDESRERGRRYNEERRSHVERAKDITGAVFVSGVSFWIGIWMNGRRRPNSSLAVSSSWRAIG
jgi:hypothetical protein